MNKGRNSRHKLFSVVTLVALVLLLSLFIISTEAGSKVSALTGNAVSDVVRYVSDLLGISSLSGTSMSRSFSNLTYSPNSPITVTIQVTVSSIDKIVNYGISESVPSGWTINSVSSTDFYSYANGKINWIINTSNLATFGSDRTLTYVVTPGTGQTGTKNFVGSAIFTSMSSGNPVQENVSMLGSSSITNTPIDSTAPGISSPSPSGTLAAGTTSTTLSVITNESATCKYSTSDVVYSSMATTFTTTGSTSHSSSVSGLVGGNSYNYYVRCMDGSGNANLASTAISFSVANSPVNAVCGSAATTYSSSATGFTGSFCTAGTASPISPAFPAQGSSTSWSCIGLYGGNNVSCTATRAAQVINGVCSSTKNQCLNGTFVDIADNSTNYLWQCLGVNGGTNATNCNALIPFNGVCGPAATTYSSNATGFSGALCTVGTASPISPAFPAQGSSTSWICLGVNGGNSSTSCTATRAAQVINGVCGASNNQCTNGTLNDIADNSTNYLWQCLGVNGGSPASCNAIIPVNAVCGPAATTYSSNATGFSGALCTVGTASPISPAFPAQGSSTSWSCIGLYGGNNLSCTATRQLEVIHGQCSTTLNGCNSGTFNDIADNSTNYLWQCLGVNGGSPASCNSLIPFNGVCGSAATTYSSNATGFSGALCTVGTASPASPAFPAQGSTSSWICLGVNGGNSSGSCTASRSGVVYPTVGDGTILSVVAGQPLIFNVTTPGDYKLTGLVNAVDGGSNSLYVNIDSNPGSGDGTGNESFAWHIYPLTAGYENREVTKVIDPVLYTYATATWSLQPGAHTLYANIRETGTAIQSVQFNLVGGGNTGLINQADVNSDNIIDADEFTSYNLNFKLQLPWPTSSSPAPSADNYTRVLYLFKLGGGYDFDSSVSCPLCWISSN